MPVVDAARRLLQYSRTRQYAAVSLSLPAALRRYSCWHTVGKHPQHEEVRKPAGGDVKCTLAGLETIEYRSRSSGSRKVTRTFASNGESLLPWLVSMG